MSVMERTLSRKVALMKRAGLIGPTTATVRRAITVDELQAAYRLVHDAFVDKKYILPHASGLRLRSFEALPEMATFVAVVEDEVVGVMAIVPDSTDLGLPSDSAFKDEIDQLRAQGRKVSEITNLAVAREYRNSPVFMQLTRACFAHAMNAGWDDIFISISPGHAAFFEGVLQFESWGPQRSYSDKIMDIVEGKRMDLRRIENQFLAADRELGPDAFLHACYFTENPCYEYVKYWDIAASKPFKDADMLRELFVETGAMKEFTDAEREAIAQRWGAVVYAAAREAPAEVSLPV